MNDSLHIVCPHCHKTNRLPSTRIAERPQCGACQQLLFSGKPIALEQTPFEQHLKNNDIPILVDFWAPWCGPCKIMGPYFEAATTLLEPKIRLIKIDTESQQTLAARYMIQSIPTLMLFLHGKEIAKSSGVMKTQDIVRWVHQHIR